MSGRAGLLVISINIHLSEWMDAVCEFCFSSSASSSCLGGSASKPAGVVCSFISPRPIVISVLGKLSPLASSSVEPNLGGDSG